MYYEHDHEAAERDLPCEALVTRRDGTSRKCGAEWTSVVHRPDQYRHWCSICEAGGDHD